MRRAKLAIVAGLLLLAACALPPPPRPTPPPTPVLIRDVGLAETRDPALPWPLMAPPGFRAQLYASELGEVRSVAFSPAGVPYVTILNRRGRDAGQVLALPDDDGDGRADRTVVVAEGIDRAHGIVFYRGELYVAGVDATWLLRDTDGDLIADERTLIAETPAPGDHWARPILFDAAGDLIVGVGSTCNMCQEKDERRATIMRFPSGGAPTTEPDGAILAHGLRSVVDIAIRPGTQELWAINHGPDHLGALEPPDQVLRIEPGAHYGWPYCFGDRQPDLQAADAPNITTPDGSPRETFCRDRVSSPALLLAPHSAPNGMAFYDGDLFPPEYQGDLFIALHGSYAYLNTNGYRVVRVPMTDGVPGPPEDFLSGWTPPGVTRWTGRPCDVAFAPDGSMFVTDDSNGYLYRVTYGS